MADEIKRPKFSLTTIQTVLAILVALGTLTATTLTIKKNFFTEKSDGNLIGVVKDKKNFKPIEGVTAEIYDSSNALLFSQITSPEGTFKKNKLKEGPYTIKVSNNNYEPEIKTVSIIGKETSEVVIYMVPLAKEKDAVTKALEQKAAEFISGFGKTKETSNNPPLTTQ